MKSYVKQKIAFGEEELFVENGCYVDCEFSGLVAEGAYFSSSLFVNCSFETTDLYWCHGFACHFIDCSFDSCDLRGNFTDAKFIRCRFNKCDWGVNNLGGETVWEDALAIECIIDNPPLPIRITSD